MQINSATPRLAPRSTSPESAPPTAGPVDRVDLDPLARFEGVPWQPFKFPGIKAQIVSDESGTWAHSKAPFTLPGLTFGHSHPASQRTSVLGGRLLIKVGSEHAHIVRPGESVDIPPNTYHRIWVLTPRFEAIDEWHPRRNDLDPPKPPAAAP